MKFRSLFYTLLCSTFLFAACSDDDDPRDDDDEVEVEVKDVPKSVLNSFQQKYPTVKDVEWETVREYYVARFNGKIARGKDYTSSAWFLKDGSYCQSDEDIAFTAMPKAAQDGFNAYKQQMYPTWEIDDCEIVAREGMGVIYVVEIELGEEEREISVSEQGDILKDVLETDDDYVSGEVLPVVVPNQVQDALKKVFPETFDQVTILEIEQEDNEIEVDVLDGKRHKEVTFDTKYNWLYTEYEVTMDEAMKMLDPKVAEKLINAAKAANIDLMDPAVQRGIEIEVNEHATLGVTFNIEIELGALDLEVTIDKDGNIDIRQDD